MSNKRHFRLAHSKHVFNRGVAFETIQTHDGLWRFVNHTHRLLTTGFKTEATLIGYKDVIRFDEAAVKIMQEQYDRNVVSWPAASLIWASLECVLKPLPARAKRVFETDMARLTSAMTFPPLTVTTASKLGNLPAPQDNPWYPYPALRPEAYGRYEVYRAGCNKQHYETWNNTGWAYNNTDITHFRKIITPFNTQIL